jgi:hypothetical protein
MRNFFTSESLNFVNVKELFITRKLLRSTKKKNLYSGFCFLNFFPIFADPISVGKIRRTIKSCIKQ